MPGRERGGEASEVEEKRALCERLSTKRFGKDTDTRENKMSDVAPSENRGISSYM